MAVKLRLTRRGKKKQPTYRIVAADARSPRDGRFIEIVGFYDPREDPSVIQVDNDKAVHWLKQGAQPSERVKKLLVISGAWKEFSGEDPPPPPAPKAAAPSRKAAAAAEAKAAAEAEASAEPEPEVAEEEASAEPEPEAAAEESGGESESSEPAAETETESETEEETT